MPAGLRDDVTLRVEANLDFRLELPGRRSLGGHLVGRGRRLELRVDDPSAFAGRADSAAVRSVAAGLARQGLVVDVVADDTVLLSLGRVRSGWWQRRVTGSRHMRVGGGRGLWTAARARARAGSSEALLPDRSLAPPATLWPVAPTFRRRPAAVTTTHAASGAGDPRRVLAAREDMGRGEPQPVFRLRRPVVTLGSDEDANICLPSLAPHHAEIHHDDDDEFTVVAGHGPVRVNGEPVERRLLRTASRVDVGPWTLVFYREEYADHGRPFGGRVGGEVGHQRPQPPRAARTQGRTRGRP